jgi:hypothetical protein
MIEEKKFDIGLRLEAEMGQYSGPIHNEGHTSPFTLSMQQRRSTPRK